MLKSVSPDRTPARCRHKSLRQANRAGQSLIEFAFLLPLLIIIIGATLSFGLFFFQANVLQQAVDVGAQELARMPFSPTAETGLGDLAAGDDTLLWDPTSGDPDNPSDGDRFRMQIYDPKYLVVHDSEWDGSTVHNNDFQAYVDTWPLLNRLLATVMVRDVTYPADDDETTAVTRFPGAVVTYVDPGSDSGGTEETVLIPMVSYDPDTAAETLDRFLAPVEEIRPGGGEGPFSVTASNSAPSFVPGMVALRINYPAQAASLINRVGTSDDGRIVGVNIVEATGPTVSGSTGNKYTLAADSDTRGAHSGTYGLGRGLLAIQDENGELAFPNGVRPYRTVMSVQAIYRREVFE